MKGGSEDISTGPQQRIEATQGATAHYWFRHRNTAEHERCGRYTKVGQPHSYLLLFRRFFSRREDSQAVPNA